MSIVFAVLLPKYAKQGEVINIMRSGPSQPEIKAVPLRQFILTQLESSAFQFDSKNTHPDIAIDLFILRKQLENLCKDEDVEEKDFRDQVATFLADRWENIRSTIVTYTQTPNTPATQLCLTLAGKLCEFKHSENKETKSVDKKAQLQFLMPTVSMDGFNEDHPDLSRFILTDDDKNVIDVHDCLYGAEEEGTPFNCYDREEESGARQLSQSEKDRLANHSDPAKEYYDAITSFSSKKNQANPAGKAILELISELKNGDYQHWGSESRASNGAMEACAVYLRFLDELKKEEPETHAELERLTAYVMQSLSRGGCVNLAYKSLQNIYNQNLDFFTNNQHRIDLLERQRNLKRIALEKAELIPHLQNNSSDRFEWYVNKIYPLINEAAIIELIDLSNEELFLHFLNRLSPANRISELRRACEELNKASCKEGKVVNYYAQELYTQINNEIPALAKDPTDKISLLTELAHRTTFALSFPNHAANNKRYPVLANKVSENPRWKKIGAGALIFFGVAALALSITLAIVTAGTSAVLSAHMGCKALEMISSGIAIAMAVGLAGVGMGVGGAHVLARPVNYKMTQNADGFFRRLPPPTAQAQRVADAKTPLLGNR